MIPHKQLEAHQRISVPDGRLTSHTSEQREKSGQDLLFSHYWVYWTTSRHHDTLSVSNHCHMGRQITKVRNTAIPCVPCVVVQSSKESLNCG